MKQKRLVRICSIILSIILMVTCTTTAFAQNVENDLVFPTNTQTEILDNGYKIVRVTGNASNARSTTATRYSKVYYTDANDVELCSFTIYGDFNTATRQCIRSYYTISTSGGQWRVEEPTQWNDGHIVYGSCVFVRRVLGIKVDSRAENLKLSYI